MDSEENSLVQPDKRVRIAQELNSNELQLQNNEQPLKPTVRDLLPQLIGSCLMYLLVVQAGIAMSFSSVLITQLADRKEIDLDTNSASIIASIWSLSLPIGAILSGVVMDRFGRKRTALLICFPFCFSWLLVSFANSIEMIYIARIISGVSTGLTTAVVVYVAEISAKTTRSGLLCMNSVWVSFGIFLTYALNYFSMHWRTISFAYAVSSSLCIFAVVAVPESPQWLLVFNKTESEERKRAQVKVSYAWLYRKQQLAAAHYDELIATNSARLNNTGEVDDTSFLESIRKPQVYKPLTILFVLFLLQQLSGGYLLIFYTINIFRNLGAEFLKTVDERLALLLVGSIRLFMAMVAAALAQKCNRKTILYISTFGMAIFAIAASMQMHNIDSSAHSLFLQNDVSVNVTAVDPSATSSANNYALLLSILGYMLFASLGILIIPWTLISELYPIKYKAKFGGSSVASAYILMSIVLKIFPFALETFTISVIFLLFGSMSFLCGLFIFFFLPETHRKTFAEIEQHFTGKKE